ncbi:protein-tyrosine phosphatase-like protein [Entophlyctis helioformis]|nr:protein-tyrosine phosphatase-like protein [Entophlyctis helioformis]
MSASVKAARTHSPSGAATVSTKLANPPTLIEHKHLRFLIFDAPSDRNIDLYARELLAQHATDVVRVCDPTYNKATFEDMGIRVHDWPFPDGEAPPDSVVQDWLGLVSQRFVTTKDKEKDKDKQAQLLQAQQQQQQQSPAFPPCIGVHCVAGLGRAPVLVAMALIEAGMAPLDSVIFIRERRRGAINARQLKYLEAYKRKSKDKSCVIQ